MAEELNNPLFEDEREFLERKKQEYERALRGDVDHIKDQSVQVGKVALVGAGLAGGIWLISKAFGGKSKSKKRKGQVADSKKQKHDHDAYYDVDADDEFDLDDEAFALDRSTEVRADDEFGDDSYGEHQHGKSARESSQASYASAAQHQHDAYYDDDVAQNGHPKGDDIENQDFDNSLGSHSHHADRPVRTTHDDLPQGRLDFGPTVHNHKQGYETVQSLPYDDSRRLPDSADFSDKDQPDYDVDATWPESSPKNSLGQQAGSLLKSFLETTTGKAVAAQVAAVVLAYVTKKVNDMMPVATTGKNADLAAVPATPSFYPATPQPANLNPAVSLTYTDAPTEHPAS